MTFWWTWTHINFLRFRALSSGVLQTRLSNAESHARQLFRNRNHQDDPTGEQDEGTLPAHVRAFYDYFRWCEDNPTRNATSAAARQRNRTNQASLVGEQPPLGPNGQPPNPEVRRSNPTGPEDAAIGSDINIRPLQNNLMDAENNSSSASSTANNRGRRPLQNADDVSQHRSRRRRVGEASNRSVRGLHGNAILPHQRTEQALAESLSLVGNAIHNLAVQQARLSIRTTPAIVANIRETVERLREARASEDNTSVQIEEMLLRSFTEELENVRRLERQLGEPAATTTTTTTNQDTITTNNSDTTIRAGSN